MSRASIVAALVLAFAGTAYADVAPPSPQSLECPRGAQGTTPTVPEGALDERGRPLRAWPYCAATTCTSDSECTDGRVCSAESIGLCMEDQTVAGGSTVRVARERGCEPDGTCLNLQSTCEQARRCVAAATPAPVVEPPPPPPPPPPPAPSTEVAPQSSCACRATAGSSASMLAPMIGLIAFALRRRRRS